MSSKPRPTVQDIKHGLNRPAIKNEQPIRAMTDPVHETIMIVSLDKLRPFEDNPRKTRNPLYDEIKASIKARGLNNPPSITKRPHQDFYIIASGGNTRLAILKELWQETGNPSFNNIPCLFKPWQDETKVLLGHLVENEMRGELTFIEKALGFAQIKIMYEKADGHQQKNPKPLSLRAFAERLEEDGFRISTSQLSRMFECMNSLLPALRQTLEGGLGKHKVEALLKLKSYLNRIWNKYTSAGDEAFLEVWLNHLYFFDQGAESIDLDNIKDAMLGELVAQLQQDYQALQMDLSLLYKNLSIDEIGSENVSAELALNLQDTSDNAEIKPPSGLIETDTEAEPTRPILSVVPPIQLSKAEAASHLNNEPVNCTDNTEGGHAVPQIRADAPLEAPIPSSIVSLPTKTERLGSIEQQLAALDGQTLADAFTGSTDNLTDNPAALRDHIGLLALEIAEWGQIKGVIQSDEDLGFTLTELSHNGSPRACSAALLLTTLLRLQTTAEEETAETAKLTSALFGGLLIGSYDIRIGTQPAESIGLERLPDALLDTLFRLIRLARRLVDLSREEKHS